MENKILYCPFCGGELTDGAAFCKYCGKKVINEPLAEPQAAPSAEEAYQAYQNQYYSQPAIQPVQIYEQPAQAPQPVSKKNAIISMIFGLIGLEFSFVWIYPIIGWIIGVPSIVFGVLAFKKSNAYIAESGSDIAFCKVGRITARIGFILTLITGIISLILFAVIFAAILSDPGAFDTGSFEYYYTAI
jgi:hypothetical protein